MSKAIYYYKDKYTPTCEVRCEVLSEVGKYSYKIKLNDYLPYNRRKPNDIITVRKRNVKLLELLNPQPDVNATDIEYEEEYEWQKYNNK